MQHLEIGVGFSEYNSDWWCSRYGVLVPLNP